MKKNQKPLINKFMGPKPEKAVSPVKPPCKELAIKCVGYDLYQCFDGKWIRVQKNDPRCGYVAPEREPVCQDGRAKCVGRDLYACHKGQWVLYQKDHDECIEQVLRNLANTEVPVDGGKWMLSDWVQMYKGWGIYLKVEQFEYSIKDHPVLAGTPQYIDNYTIRDDASSPPAGWTIELAYDAVWEQTHYSKAPWPPYEWLRSWWWRKDLQKRSLQETTAERLARFRGAGGWTSDFGDRDDTVQIEPRGTYYVDAYQAYNPATKEGFYSPTLKDAKRRIDSR